MSPPGLVSVPWSRKTMLSLYFVPPFAREMQWPVGVMISDVQEVPLKEMREMEMVLLSVSGELGMGYWLLVTNKTGLGVSVNKIPASWN